VRGMTAPSLIDDGAGPVGFDAAAADAGEATGEAAGEPAGATGAAAGAVAPAGLLVAAGAGADGVQALRSVPASRTRAGKRVRARWAGRLNARSIANLSSGDAPDVASLLRNVGRRPFDVKCNSTQAQLLSAAKDLGDPQHGSISS